MSATEDNLKEAFAGESQANQRYLAFSQQAEAEDLPNIARLFRAAAAAEGVHAGNHLRAMDGVGETRENLEAAREGEHEEVAEMYPPMLEEANEAGHEDAADSFHFALEVEKIHHNLYGKAMEALEAGEDIEPTLIFVCRNCGNTVEGAPPEECPICGAPQHWFMLIA